MLRECKGLSTEVCEKWHLFNCFIQGCVLVLYKRKGKVLQSKAACLIFLCSFDHLQWRVNLKPPKLKCFLLAWKIYIYLRFFKRNVVPNNCFVSWECCTKPLGQMFALSCWKRLRLATPPCPWLMSLPRENIKCNYLSGNNNIPKDHGPCREKWNTHS